MEIFGLGPLELLAIVVLALVVLGPEDMVGTARRLGQWVARIVRSPTWRAMINTTNDLREIPSKIVREANLEETVKEMRALGGQVQSQVQQTTREVSTEIRQAGAELSSDVRTIGGIESAAQTPPPPAEPEPPKPPDVGSSEFSI